MSVMFVIDLVTSVYVWVVLGLVALYKAHKWVKKRRFQHSLFKRLGIPYVKPHLLYGSLHLLRGRNRKGNELDLVAGWMKQYGSCFGYYLGPIPYLMVSDLDMVKQILVKDFSNFANRPKLVIKAQPVTATLVGLRDQQWKDVRTLLTPTFSAAKMKLMVNAMNRKVDEMMRIMEESFCDRNPLGFYSLYQGLTLDVISECALALKTDCQRDQNKDPLFKAVRQFLKNAVNPAILWAMYFPFVAKILAFVSNHLVLSGRATQMIISNLKEVLSFRRRNAHLRNTDLIQLMLDASEDLEDSQKAANGAAPRPLRSKRILTDEHIIANSWVFLLGGFETTAAALTYTSYLLAQNPLVQEKLYEEVSAISLDDSNHFSYDDVSGLSYLDQVFNESLRLYPPVVTFISRETKEDTMIKDILIPRGTNVSIPVWSIHHNSEYWPDPYKFDPERFSASSVSLKERHPMTFIPFGEGPRKCIGMRFAQMEAKLALARIISVYRLEVCKETSDPLTFDIPTVSLNPSQEVFIKAVKRSSL